VDDAGDLARQAGDESGALPRRQDPLERTSEEPDLTQPRLEVGEVAPEDDVVEVGGVRRVSAGVGRKARASRAKIRASLAHSAGLYEPVTVVAWKRP